MLLLAGPPMTPKYFIAPFSNESTFRIIVYHNRLDLIMGSYHVYGPINWVISTLILFILFIATAFSIFYLSKNLLHKPNKGLHETNAH